MLIYKSRHHPAVQVLRGARRWESVENQTDSFVDEEANEPITSPFDV